MAKFKLCEDLKIITWRRYHYTVEADTLEDNDGEVTREIYNEEDDKLLYDNVRGDV